MSEIIGRNYVYLQPPNTSASRMYQRIEVLSDTVVRDSIDEQRTHS